MWAGNFRCQFVILYVSLEILCVGLEILHFVLPKTGGLFFWIFLETFPKYKTFLDLYFGAFFHVFFVTFTIFDKPGGIMEDTVERFLCDAEHVACCNVTHNDVVVF